MKQNEQKLVEYQAKKIERIKAILDNQKEKVEAQEKVIQAYNSVIASQSKEYELLYDRFLEIEGYARLLAVYVREAIIKGFKYEDHAKSVEMLVDMLREIGGINEDAIKEIESFK